VDLYLIRHAEALELGERGVTDDAQRPLSERGEEQSRAAAQAFPMRGITLDRLYASPLLRARQTAEILLRAWSRPELTLETCEELTPGTKPRKLSRFLLKQEGEQIGLVGHMPDLATFAGWLLGDKKLPIEIAKAGVVHLTCGDMPGKGLASLVSLVTPEWY
jgi:phosphohistidine phosphatase